LAVAIAYRAIQNGFEARFTSATALIDDLSTATATGRLGQVLPGYTHPHVLVIDEVGYLSYGPDAANVLFQVVNDRYLHHRPMIFTTNKPLAAWGRVLHDPDLAKAILDRVLERGRHLELRGPSYRTRHVTLDLHHDLRAPSGRPTRISGNRVSEFPEPTPIEDGRSLTVPLEWFPWLRDATAEARGRWELIGRGLGIHWPELDEDALPPRPPLGRGGSLACHRRTPPERHRVTPLRRT
jgi:hypothetical protein